MTLEQRLREEFSAVGFKETEMNQLLIKAISAAVKKYLNEDVKASVSSGSSSGSHKLVAQ